MSADQTRATLLAFVNGVGAADAFERHLAADATFTALATGRVIRGRAAVAGFIRTFYWGAFAARGRINAMLFDPDGRLLIDLHLAGRHVGEYLGIPATGRRICVRCRLTCEAQGDEVVAITGHLPVDQLLAQLRGEAAAG